MNRSILQRLAILTIFGGVAITHTAFAAQLQTQFTVPRGSIFEIIAQHSITSPQYSWVLSRDGTFVEAKRDSLFRSRLIEAGNYSLNAEISNPDGTQRVQSVIRISVPSENSSTIRSQNKNGVLVTTYPSLDKKNRIISSADQIVIRMESANDDITEFSLDLDAKIDSDNRGDPTSNNDVAGTYFAGRTTPLFVWLTAPKSDHTLTLRATFKDGTTREQRIRLIDRSTAQQEDRFGQKEATIEASDLQAGAYSFAARFEKKISYPALYQWDFGDGKQSLLDSPVHTYTRNGTYTVRLIVRNLKTGEASDEVSKVVTTTSVSTVPTAPDNKPENDRDKGSFLGLLIKVGLVGGIAVLFSIIIVFLISKLRRGSSLQEKLEVAEQKIVSKEKDEEETLPPMEIIEEAEVIEESPVSKSKPKPEPKPEPVPELTPDARRPTPEPKPKPEPEPEPNLPPWLQPSTKKVEAPKAPAKPKPKPEPESEPKPQPTPNAQRPTPEPQPTPNAQHPTPEPQPTPNAQRPTPKPEGPVPEWLQTNNNQESKPDDEPIAFLRAESVEEEEKKKEQGQDPQKHPKAN